MNEKTLALTDAQIVTPMGIYPGTLHIAGGKIVSIEKKMERRADRVMDVEGKLVFPGFIDGHVHMMDPGHTECEEFDRGTAAAAKSGVTTVIEHPRTVPPVLEPKILKEKAEYLKKKTVINFGLLGGIISTNLDQAYPMWEAGALGFKVFTVEVHETPPLLAGELAQLFRSISRFGGVTLIHAEDDSIVKANEKELRASGRKDYMLHTEMHTPEAQMAAVEMVLFVANYALKGEARAIFAHISDPACLYKINEARLKGIQVYAETMPHYLHLIYEDLKKKGPFVKFTPTVRSPEVVAEMWSCFNRDLIHLVSTDHAPQPREVVEQGLSDIWKSPLTTGANIDVGSRLMLNAVSQGKTTAIRLARVMSETPARLYGLYPRKGVIQVGSDADLVVVDMSRKEKITPESIVSKGGWTMYDGMEIQGAPVITFVAGEIVYDYGKVVGKPGMGQFITRSPLP